LTRDLFPGTHAFQLAGPEGRGRLLSALAQHKAAALHFSLTKNHPYVDGNKRLAVTAMEWFLWRNRIAMLASNSEIVESALDVANDPINARGSVSWVRSRAVRMAWSEQQIGRWLGTLSEEHLVGVEQSFRRGDVDQFASVTMARIEHLLERVQPRIADA